MCFKVKCLIYTYNISRHSSLSLHVPTFTRFREKSIEFSSMARVPFAEGIKLYANMANFISSPGGIT